MTIDTKTNCRMPGPPKHSFFKAPNELDAIQTWDKVYMAVGGCGDLLCLLSSIWDKPDAKVLYCANETNFAPKFLDLFGITHHTIRRQLGDPQTRRLYEAIKPKLQLAGALPDNLDIDEWKHWPDKYASRIVTSVPWRETLGKKQYDKKTLIVQPSGGTRYRGRQRFLSKDEYIALLSRYKDWHVISTGSATCKAHYGGLGEWIICDELLPYLQALNGADLIIGPDSWLKTYASLVGIPCIVIRTRYNGVYHMLGQDCSDSVFLNGDIWPNLKHARIESLIDGEPFPLPTHGNL